MNLNEDELVRALGLAATQAGGLYSATMAKRLNAPKAVMGGIMAADLAKRGLEAPPDSIEAEYSGFVTTFSRTPDLAVIDRDLGKYRFEIYHKFYPCIRSNQPTVENVRLMLQENPEITEKSIRRIVSHVDKLTIEYTVLTTAGGAEGVRTPGHALISLPPTERYRCTTEIHLDNGRVIKRFLPAAKGDPENRLTPQEMYGKFMSNATTVVTESTARAIFGALESVENLKDVCVIARKLVGSPRAGAAR